MYVECFKRTYKKLADAGLGTTTWTPLYHNGPAYVPSSDFWCMVSPQMAREMILPDILLEMEPLERSIFHLDGVQALKHLDLILEIPHLNAVQWVFGEGYGPASRWVDVYRRILQAGKGIQLLAEDAHDALNVLERVGTKGVWVTVGKAFASVDEANMFLKHVERCRHD
jgi:hypothetical protein